ncbi:MAG: NAD(P)-binding domain-containing protein [Microbacteriaceae bacterium]|nr:NAD(P)-binding domain-containing protein [Microbacteriaceae bacterium]
MIENKLGIIGNGKSGCTIARLAYAGGWQATISGTGSATRTRTVTSIFAPDALVAETSELIASHEMIVIAVPMFGWKWLPLESFAGRILIDVMNYWPEVDGPTYEYEQGVASSQIFQDALPATTSVVKTFNHIGHHNMLLYAAAKGSPARKALAVAGDDETAIAKVSQFVDDAGFDPVYAGTLAESRIMEPGGPVFDVSLNKSELEDLLN